MAACRASSAFKHSATRWANWQIRPAAASLPCPTPNLCPRWTTVVTRPPALELGADDVWVTPVAVLSDGDVITGNALGLVRPVAH